MPKKTLALIIGLIATTIILFFIALSTAHAATYPANQHFVNDDAHVLSDKTTQDLNQKLQAYQDKTSNQVIVLTIDTTGEQTIEDYGIHLADDWKIGQKGKDNGVIFIIAVKDHHTRIEIGRGLEGELTDIQTHRIQDEQVMPYLKQNKFDVGITNGVNKILSSIATESATPTPTASPVPFTIIGGVILLVLVFVILFILSLIFGDDSIFSLIFQIAIQIVFILISGGQSTGGGGSSSEGSGGSFSGGGSSDDF